MTNDEKKKILTAYLQASAHRDVEEMASFLTEDFTLGMVPSAAEQGLPNPIVGRQTFLDFLRQLMARPDMWKPRESLPQQFLFDEDSVAVRVRNLGDFPSGLVYDNEYVFIYKLRGDKICEMREFTDAAYIYSLRQKAAAQAG